MVHGDAGDAILPLSSNGGVFFDAQCLLQELQRRDIQITVDGDHLRYDAPDGAMTAELLAQVRQHKPAILALFQATTPGSALEDVPVPPGPELPDVTHDPSVILDEATAQTEAPPHDLPPCAVCGGADRWLDIDVWRCRACWPDPLTASARRAAAHDERMAGSAYSAILGTAIWVAETADQAEALQADGRVVYTAEEVGVLRDLKARDPQGFPEKLRQLHATKMPLGGRLEGLAAPAPPQTPAPPRQPAPCLHQWRAGAPGQVVCGRCGFAAPGALG